MAVKIAVIGDSHYAELAPNEKRKAHIADLLMMRLVNRMNRLVRPDIVLLVGDVVDEGDDPDEVELLKTIRDILDKLDAPYIAIPGNHDGAHFYDVFGRPEPILEVNGARFVSFPDDPDEPGYNSSRSRSELKRYQQARYEFDGPIVSVQHVPVFPPGTTPSPYNYLNVDEVTEAMRESGVCASISGHYHKGADPVVQDDTTFITVPAVCEGPFRYGLVSISDDGKVRYEVQQLAMPAELGLIDTHLHTDLAYCSENMDIPKAIELAELFGLGGLSFTEHSGHLYFSREDYSWKTCFPRGIAAAQDKDLRMDQYLAMKNEFESDTVRFSLEVDADHRGNLILRTVDRHRFDQITGAVHSLPGLGSTEEPGKSMEETFLAVVESLLSNGMRVLAHPFRVYRRAGWSAPESLFNPTAQLIRKYDTAAEINYHTNEPPIGFIRSCLEMGVRLSFGSDAHNLYEIGDFAFHRALLAEAGFTGNLRDVLTPESFA